jgi:tetrahydromethanopterin S-methyltransferase subunit G
MSDEKPVPETLETLAEKIGALGKAIDAQFAQVDARFDQVDARFDQVDARFEQIDARITTEIAEVKTHLGVKIEALAEDVRRVYDAVIGQQTRNERNDTDHATFARRLDNHDVRLLALEKKPRSR